MITYSGTQDGVPVTIVVRVVDNGEGANATGPDTISVTSTGGYSASGTVGGNIQIHMPKGCSTTTSRRRQGRTQRSNHPTAAPLNELPRRIHRIRRQLLTGGAGSSASAHSTANSAPKTTTFAAA